MTIEKGSDWGSIVEQRKGGIDAAGDIALELGVESGIDHKGAWRRLPLDVLTIVATAVDGSRYEWSTPTWLRCGGRLRGECIVLSSTSYVDGSRLFSRAHPNDGRLDWLAIDGTMRLRQRREFWRRTRTQTHLPHPLVRTGSNASFEHRFTRPVTVTSSDGRHFRRIAEIVVRVTADATHTHIPSL